MLHCVGTVGSNTALPFQTEPLISQIDLSPVVTFCHRKSRSPSPSKSAAPAMCQAVGTAVSREKLPLQTLPFMNQIEVCPVLALCHTRSGLPSLLKSPAATIFHAIGTLGRSAALA